MSRVFATALILIGGLHSFELTAASSARNRPQDLPSGLLDAVSRLQPEAHPWHSGVDHGPAFEDVSALLSWERIDDPVTTHLGGAAWLDYDDDGDLDLYLVNAPGGDNALLRNDGGSFVDVAVQAGVTGEGSGFTGALAGDIDNDGCTDLFLTGAGGFFGIGLPSRLYRNDCDGTFSDITASSGIVSHHISLMAAFGDIDRDGFIDLFVASPGNFFTGILTPQKLYHNNGDGTFTDISATAGIDTAFGGCVVAFSDFNEDRWPDILVGNCGDLDTSGAQPFPVPGAWELWLNQGDLTFVDSGTAAGLGRRPGFPMAITSADCDADGDLDIFATGMGPLNPFSPGILGEQVLFQNNGDGTYSDGSHAAGLSGFEWGWGASFADFDNDGDEDLATVGSIASPILSFLGDLAGPGRVFENGGSCDFQAKLNFALQDQATSGLAVADYDGDGFRDLVIVKTAFDISTPAGQLSGDGRPVLLHNLGNSNRSLTLRLVGTDSNAMAIGARVKALTPSGVQIREAVAGSSFSSTNSPWIHFGLGKRRWALLRVEWPSGRTEIFFRFARRSVQTVREGSGFEF